MSNRYIWLCSILNMIDEITSFILNYIMSKNGTYYNLPLLFFLEIYVNISVQKNRTEYAQMPYQLKRFKQFVFLKTTFGFFL